MGITGGNGSQGLLQVVTSTTSVQRMNTNDVRSG